MCSAFIASFYCCSRRAQYESSRYPWAIVSARTSPQEERAFCMRPAYMRFIFEFLGTVTDGTLIIHIVDLAGRRAYSCSPGYTFTVFQETGPYFAHEAHICRHISGPGEYYSVSSMSWTIFAPWSLGFPQCFIHSAFEYVLISGRKYFFAVADKHLLISCFVEVHTSESRWVLYVSMYAFLEAFPSQFSTTLLPLFGLPLYAFHQ